MRAISFLLSITLVVFASREVKAEDVQLGAVEAIERTVTVNLDECFQQLKIRMQSAAAYGSAVFFAECKLGAQQATPNEILFSSTTVERWDSKDLMTFRGDAAAYLISVQVRPGISKDSELEALNGAKKSIEIFIKKHFPNGHYTVKALKVKR